MKITFSAIGSGFANNGGSKTILSCANALSDLGHDVCIAAEDFSFTWFKVKAKRINKLPNDGVIVATAVATVKPLLKHRSRVSKLWYVRGWETWAVPEGDLISAVRSIPVIVNSEWLQGKVAEYASRPSIVYPGLDVDVFFKEEVQKRVVTVGGLYHIKKLKRFGLWLDVMREVMSKRDVSIRLFGDGPKPKLPFPYEYVQQPNPRAHRRFYNLCDIWFFTSENEGLHIPPMEAGLCGCALVGSDIGGVRDYAVHGETALLGDNYADNIIRLVDDGGLRDELSGNLRHLLIEKIGNRRDNMCKFISVVSE